MFPLQRKIIHFWSLARGRPAALWAINEGCRSESPTRPRTKTAILRVPPLLSSSGRRACCELHTLVPARRRPGGLHVEQRRCILAAPHLFRHRSLGRASRSTPLEVTMIPSRFSRVFACALTLVLVMGLTGVQAQDKHK